MIVLSQTLSVLENSKDILSLYYAKDVLLGALPVLVFYGPSTTGNSTLNSSRIQAHIYTLAGFHSHPRIIISPSSPLYAAVSHLPVEKQGDEICRGLAVSLLKYFSEIPKHVQASLKNVAARGRPSGLAPAMFDEMHAAQIVTKMVKVENTGEIISYITSSLIPQALSWVDMDVILPPESIQRAKLPEESDNAPSLGEDGLPLAHYSDYNTLVTLLGSPSFLPTSKLRRAPSRPTAHSKNRSLNKDQKIALRREMCELLDTEERYVNKIYELVHGEALAFRSNSQNIPYANGGSRENTVEQLFPKSLDRILEVNTTFFEDIRGVLEQTENEAITDIEGVINIGGEQGRSYIEARKRDSTGITILAKALLKWFPKFMSPYQEYLRTSTGFPKILQDCLRDNVSSLARQVQEFGEQRIRSLLIEPVQRLPRYSLFIDNIVNLLPSSHSALTSLLKARDVITDICALDSGNLSDSTQTISRLRDLVAAWPASVSPRGRLITAVDVVELDPPYKVAATAEDFQSSLLLLFPDTVVLLRKSGRNAMSARGVLAEIERPVTFAEAHTPSFNVDREQSKGLTFVEANDLRDLRFTESHGGDSIQILCSGQSSMKTSAKWDESLCPEAYAKVFYLLGPYECKAARWSEEVARARIEGRYPEKVRESGKWALRTMNASHEGLGIIAAIFEESVIGHSNLQGTNQIRVRVNKLNNPISVPSPGPDNETTMWITLLDTGCYRLDCKGFGESSFTDNATDDDLVTILNKRLGDVLRIRHDPKYQALLNSHTAIHRSILQTIPIKLEDNEPRSRSFRPISPVKLLSNFLGGSSKDLSSPSKLRSGASIVNDIPPMLPPIAFASGPFVNDNMEEPMLDSKVTLIGVDAVDDKKPLVLLEDTFAAYIVALRSRSGNVVGRVLRGRAGADELIVNELYNTLIEDPSKIQAAAEVSVDVLFAAFEIFLNRAWRERMGPVIAPGILRNIQSTFESGKPNEIVEHFKRLLDEMTPQNKRAFTNIVKLLSDLLEASGNDGDRGALIATFAEALVTDGNPLDYISSLDRLVDDYDNLFDEVPATSSVPDSLQRNRSVNTGSLSSNASSLRKRFGFGSLSRENSKLEPESKVSSVWRTFSKTSKNTVERDSRPASLSKGSLLRSKSTDTDLRALPTLRPVSRDRPATGSSSPAEGSQSRPGSSHVQGSILSTIGEIVPNHPVSFVRKKRRSSLSDLRAAQSSAMASPWPQTQAPNAIQHPSERLQNSPRTPLPSKLALRQQSDRLSPQHFGSPQRLGSPQRFGAPQHKENSPSMPCKVSTKSVAKHGSDEAVASSPNSKKRIASQSAIPAPKQVLSERSLPVNSTISPPKKLPQPPQKLRMQSPQKLRERLSNEQRAISGAETSLQAELAKIGEELSAFKSNRTTIKPSLPTPATPILDLRALTSRVTTLDSKLSSLLTDLKSRTTLLEKDLESSLVVSERKARKLDELYREANAENEALYERFNEELDKVLKGVRAGEGVEEMRGVVREGREEVQRLKREGQRLRRENVGLRCQLAGG